MPCKPKTLKMSAYGTFSPTARPPRVLPTPWALPTPAFATWQGCREKPPAPLPQALGRLQPVKAKPLRGSSQALTGFQLRPLRLVLLPHGDGEGSRATKSCILPLTPWNRPNTHRRGRWIGFATCPCGLASVSGVWGKAPRLVFVFEVVRVDVTVQKRSKKCAF